MWPGRVLSRKGCCHHSQEDHACEIPQRPAVHFTQPFMGGDANVGSANLATHLPGGPRIGSVDKHQRAVSSLRKQAILSPFPAFSCCPQSADLSAVHFPFPKTRIHVFAYTPFQWWHSIDYSVLSIRIQVPKGKKYAYPFYLCPSIWYLTNCLAWA